MVHTPQLGSVVHSLAGRDAGQCYLVVEILDSNYVLVANGLNRPLQRPKRKNLRHLQLSRSMPELALKVRHKEISNEDLAKVVRELEQRDQTGGEREGIRPDV